MRLTSRPSLLALFALLMAASLTTGCATGGAVKNVQSDVGDVEDQVRVLSRQVATLDSLLRAQREESRRMQAEFDTDAGDVKQRVRQVQAKLDEVALRLADLAKGLESLRLYTGGRGASSGRPPASANPSDLALASRPSLVSDDQGLYDLASEDMNAGNYPLAISEFSQLLETFPQSSLADKARYWLGECYYKQKDFPRAIDAFQRVLTDYPGSEKVPAAMLQLGYVLLEAKDRANGLQRLRTLIKDHPKSEEAGLARKRLSELTPGGAPRRR